jgi:hypothetical protein
MDSSMIETMIEFRLKPIFPAKSPGEVVLLRVSQIAALFPEHKHIRNSDTGIGQLEIPL